MINRAYLPYNKNLTNLSSKEIIMNIETSLIQSIATIQTLSETNSLLTRMVEDGVGEAIDTNKRYMEIINHCSKIYEYLNRKSNKTWEEKESLELLFKLITGEVHNVNTTN